MFNFFFLNIRTPTCQLKRRLNCTQTLPLKHLEHTARSCTSTIPRSKLNTKRSNIRIYFTDKLNFLLCIHYNIIVIFIYTSMYKSDCSRYHIMIKSSKNHVFILHHCRDVSLNNCRLQNIYFFLLLFLLSERI